MRRFSFFSDIRIRPRMLLLFQSLSVALFLIFAVFMFALQRLHAITNKILTENVTSIRAAYNVEISLLNLKGLKANFILDGDESWLSFFNENEREFTRWYNEAFDSAKTQEERDILSGLSVEFEKYLKTHNQIIILLKNHRRNQAISLLLNESNETFDAINAACEKLILQNETLISESERTAAGYLAWARYFGYSIIVLFVIIGVLLALIVAKSIVKPLREMDREVELILNSAGETRSSKNEVERLRERFGEVLTLFKENQKKMIRSEKRAVAGSMAAGVSHELNNPIGIICGFSERLLKSGKLNAKQREAVSEISKEATRCKKMLGELLDYARPMQYTFAPVNISALLRESVGLFERQESYHSINFVVDLPLVGKRIVADTDRIKQVFVNIIKNAIEAVPLKGLIAIALENKAEGVRIRIRDNGRGITSRNTMDIFKPFYSTKSKGVGLGLSVSQDIIEQHGGSIRVETEAGKYTEFIIDLPGGK